MARWMLVLALVVTVGACGGDDESGKASGAGGGDGNSTQANAFVGAVQGTDAYIGVLTYPDGTAFAYVCDGTDTTKATVAANLEGTVDGRELALESVDGVEVDGSVNGNVSGTVKIDGEDHSFTAAAVDQDGYAGLYAASEGDDTTDRWIVRDDQTLRGARRRAESIELVPPIQPWTDPNPQPLRTTPWVDPDPAPWTDPEPSP